jgi:hypothetical protein
VTPPHASVRALSADDLRRNLMEEMEEEIGGDVSGGRGDRDRA